MHKPKHGCTHTLLKKLDINRKHFNGRMIYDKVIVNIVDAKNYNTLITYTI